MSVLPEKTYISPEEYLVMERASLEKHEYLNGEIFQMAGTSIEHAGISSNINISLGLQFKGRGCQSFQSDLRVHVPKTGLYTYPDIVAVCGEPQIVEDEYLDILLNPVLIIEVLSPSTAAYDKGAKFEHYRTIESLREYLLVWQDKKRVARHTKRDGEGWLLTDFIGDDAAIFLESVDATLTIEDIYDKVNFK